MEIFSISLCNIEKVLALKFTIDSIKKLLTKYYDFLNIFSQADLGILSLHYLCNHKRLFMEGKNLL